jgi:murein DD-endopeptidase MepM/ murein hydrolase activator NlpD
MITLTPPTRQGFVSSAWGADRSYRGPGAKHEGLDFPGQVGEPVLAAADGVVVHVDNSDSSFAGRWVAIRHNGLTTRYLHNTRNLVSVGQRVSRGQQIAELGTTGTVSAKPHVHFDVKASAEAVAEYLAKFGKPTTGLGTMSSGMGQGVPAEPYMSGATYSATAKAASIARNVPFHGGAPPYVYWIAAAGLGYAVYRWFI